ncbi:MAG: ferrous iron transport protein A [Alphaproteobacteria bacterium]|nr:ferrous iron transport protein A [Alphaproteobacteria bacterium]
MSIEPIPVPTPSRHLCDLPKSTRGRIVAIDDGAGGLAAKLREIGFAENDEVEVLAFGPIGGRPLCVRLNETMIALRPEEARLISVEVL